MRATINGVDYTYEVHGDGEPLLLLHGGLLTMDSFGPAMPTLTKGRRVIAVDLQGHGRSTLGDRPLRCEPMADDLHALLQQLGHGQVDVLGYSFGGGVALRLAAQHPGTVRRLALVCTVFSDDGWYEDIRVQQKQISAAIAPMMMATPLYTTYQAVAPKPQEFPRLLDAMGDFMRQRYDWSADVAALRMPVMLVFGDADSIRPAHQIAFYELLGGGARDAGWNRENMPRNRLAIVPDMTHYEPFASARIADLLMPFLDGHMAGAAKSAAG
ncbi:MAG: alpha/beta fold hydrolase [Polyangia bacterium]